ncbi:hypothetical protein MPTK1_4g01730 [Marchantia polymorpha subsp. ruderalis]|uniref:Uncharacterized protein n=2 Tax=Marchantia polymorpha TaxID=3197 RepID=A0AAF6B597_MARPO|nr:hypothetical protein MARPO_0098s0027 [Marchantia polymorpha]BBN07181.1 hypothetical protein Mp_4g01730 [Marchantia polymorpha subsp. ruderalis]|eukprot:PTQ32478.1 hypothetical protein MARPO_0098s0027 [Marchantia polymorpha]
MESICCINLKTSEHVSELTLTLRFQHSFLDSALTAQQHEAFDEVPGAGGEWGPERIAMD